TADGWLCTSDFGYYDETGWFYFVDRARDVIKRAAETISATEIETVLTAHPLIADAAVIGVPDPIRDQAIVAFVQLQAGAQLTATEIGAYCAANLSDCKRPQVIEIVATFPRTASQKIAKRQLADRYLNPQKGSQ
ncbi:MAG: long-chain fatty acid--CoA ligase, partial [Propionibacteriaceae bacterium]|nr:long-chain fatty acid--CoA ligase [Propionibacteriaceae bacterium]